MGIPEVLLDFLKPQVPSPSCSLAGSQHPSMIIFLLNGPLNNQVYGYSLDEVSPAVFSCISSMQCVHFGGSSVSLSLSQSNDIRKMGGYVYGVGTGQSERSQVTVQMTMGSSVS